MAFFALTSTSLLWTAIAVTTACFLWTIFWVPQRRWRGSRAYAQQALGVTISALLFFSTAFLVFNRFSIWYSDWQDLFGYASNHGKTTQYGGNGEALAAGGSPTATASPSASSSSGTLWAISAM